MTALTLDEEFWSNVSIGEVIDCWRWREVEGYGSFIVNGQTIMAHRYAWSFAYGDIPEGKLVLHGCDNRWCVNPRHLRLGTIEENNADKTVVARARDAADSARRKREAVERLLSAPRVARQDVAFCRVSLLLRSQRKTIGRSQQQIADEIGVSQASVAHWERGATLPRNLATVARAYGLDVDALSAAYVADRDLEVSP